MADVQDELERLFGRFERMTDADMVLMRTIWEGQDPQAREEAWTIVKFAIKHHHRQDLLDGARDRVSSWVNNYASPMVRGDVPALDSGSGMDPGSIRRAAIPPMLDAIAATIAGDELGEAQRAVLLEPLTEMGSPPAADD